MGYSPLPNLRSACPAGDPLEFRHLSSCWLCGERDKRLSVMPMGAVGGHERTTLRVNRINTNHSVPPSTRCSSSCAPSTLTGRSCCYDRLMQINIYNSVNRLQLRKEYHRRCLLHKRDFFPSPEMEFHPLE